MAVDFTSPVKTQNYDTGVLQSIRANQIAIASFLDGQTITGNTAGLKRYNASSQLFEKSDGTNWTTMPLAYLGTAGGTMTGLLTLSGNATANLNPVPLQQMNSALSGYASSSSLSNYAALSGAGFTGSVSVAGNLSTASGFSASGSISGSAMTAAGSIIAANVSLTTAGTFYLGSSDANTPIVNFDANDYLGYNRGGNTLTTYIGGAAMIVTNATGNTLNGALTWASSGGSSYSGNFHLYNNGTGNGPYVRVNPSNGMEMVDSGYANINFTFSDNGNFQSRGLLFGRGGGAGLGQITVQSGGSPSGGAAGDLFLIY